MADDLKPGDEIPEGWMVLQQVVYGDDELNAIHHITRILDHGRLTDTGRARIVDYLSDRYGPLRYRDTTLQWRAGEA